MSGEYPCAYYDNEKCKKFSEDGITSYCVLGPCSYETPSNADRIRAMSDDELAEFLDQIAYAEETPWSKPFAEKFCKSCPEPEYTLDDGRELRLHECDFKDGVCPHGGDIVWWLKQPEEEDDHE